MVINQGDIFWIDLGTPSGSGPGYRHPYVVIQNNLFNHSRLDTVVVCELTSNLDRAKAPGNVRLASGDGNFPRPSVVNVTQLYTVDRSELVQKIGTLSERRMSEILAGVHLVLDPREGKE